MEKEFDNEIDALLRKEAGGRTITVSEFASPHLDADEISAFAENALPHLTKLKYGAHFADCDDCRKTLSSVIQLNSEAGTEKATQVAAPVTAAAEPIPWHKKLFLFPNLAYVMGGLVVLFGGFLAFSVLQYSGENTGSQISQTSVEEYAPASGPNPSQEEVFSDSNASADYSMNSAANTSANMATSNTNMSVGRGSESAANSTVAARQEPPAFALDGTATQGASPPPAAVPLATPADTAVTMRKVENLPKTAELLKDSKESERSGVDLKMRSATPPALGEGAKSKASAKNENDAVSRDDRQLSELKAVKPDASARPGRKQAGGRTFELRQNVWYDSSYRGQATVNVRRGTDDYKKLSSGLRSIADSIAGTVVIVWNEKAYRIQ